MLAVCGTFLSAPSMLIMASGMHTHRQRPRLRLSATSPRVLIHMAQQMYSRHGLPETTVVLHKVTFL